MGLFSEHKRCRNDRSKCACGGETTPTALSPAPVSFQQPPVKPTRGEDAPSTAATKDPGGTRSVNPDEYIKYMQRSFPKASHMVIRGLVNKHLDMDSDMPMQTMLKKVRAQLKQV